MTHCTYSISWNNFFYVFKSIVLPSKRSERTESTTRDELITNHWNVSAIVWCYGRISNDDVLFQNAAFVVWCQLRTQYREDIWIVCSSVGPAAPRGPRPPGVARRSSRVGSTTYHLSVWALRWKVVYFCVKLTFGCGRNTTYYNMNFQKL